MSMGVVKFVVEVTIEAEDDVSTRDFSEIQDRVSDEFPDALRFVQDRFTHHGLTGNVQVDWDVTEVYEHDREIF